MQKICGMGIFVNVNKFIILLLENVRSFYSFLTMENEFIRWLKQKELETGTNIIFRLRVAGNVHRIDISISLDLFAVEST